MTQADLFLENQLFPSFRADLNNNLLALASLSSGTGEPPNPVAYMFWADSGTGSLKLRNAANSDWLTVGNLTQQNLGLSTATTGHVLQFQYASTSAQVQLNDNNSWQNAGPSITITPQQANSVLLLYLVVGGVKTDGSLVTLRVIQQGGSASGTYATVGAATGATYHSVPLFEIDTPGSTDERTYLAQFQKAGGSAAYAQWNTTKSTAIALELKQ